MNASTQRPADPASENDILRRRVAALEQELADLDIALSTAIEHGDFIEAQLAGANQQLQQEVSERKVAERRLQALMEALRQQRDDLEILVGTLVEHGDTVDAQWWEKLTDAENRAATDILTGLPNRRHLEDHLERHWREAVRFGRPISVLMCDIDLFKQFNDTYGHQAGDSCLAAVAEALGKAAHRAGDLAARYGGEEFSVVLPDTDEAGALACANNILAAVRALAIPHAKSPKGHVTLSIGVATSVAERDAKPADLIGTADRRLYQAKQQGRDQASNDPSI